jgi:hypothetical protein
MKIYTVLVTRPSPVHIYLRLFTDRMILSGLSRAGLYCIRYRFAVYLVTLILFLSGKTV